MKDILPSNSSGELQNDSLVHDDQTIFHSFMDLVISIIVVMIGVPGNCLILRVYWTKTRKTSTRVLILALAWADFAVCALRLFIFAVLLLGLAEVRVWRAYNGSQLFQSSLTHIFFINHAVNPPTY